MSRSRDVQLHVPTMSSTTPRLLRRLTRRLFLVGLLAMVLLIVWQGSNWFRQFCRIRAQAEISESQFSTARQWIERMRWGASENLDASLCEIRLLRKERKFQQAFESLARAKRLNSSSKELGFEEWLLQAEAGDLTSAERPLLNALRENAGDESEICEALVLGYLRTGQFFKAELTLQSWHTEHPQDARHWVLRGVMATKTEHWKDAAAAYREALRLSPNDPVTTFFLADALSMNRDFENALPLFRRSAAALPDRVEVQLGFVRTLTNLGQSDEAIRLAEQIVRSHPDSIDARKAFGEALLAAKQAVRAIEVLEPAADRSPNDIGIRFQLGTALRLAGRPDEAEPHLEFARQGRLELRQRGALTLHALKFPNDSAVRVQLARLLLKYDLKEEGLMWLRGILELDPNHSETHRLLAEYYRREAAKDPKLSVLAEHHERRAARTQP